MEPDSVFWIAWTLFGAIVGSFLNAFVYRWPRRISMVSRSRSFCPTCEATIGWYDNIPILSYLMLRGKCRSCKKRIPIRYLVLEVLTASLFSLAFYQGRFLHPDTHSWPFVVIASIIVADLLALSFVDIETYTVPFVNSLSLLVGGVVLAPLWPLLQLSATEWVDVARLDAWLNSVQGVLLGGGLVWSVGAAAELALRKEAMGGGDVKILAGVGALFGWKAAIAAFFLAVFLGAFTGVAMILWDRISVRLRKKRIGVKGIEEGITYKYDADEEAPPSDEDVVKSHRLTWIGLVVALEQIAMLYFMPGARTSLLAAIPFLFGVTLGFFIVFYDILRRRLVREGKWIDRDIVTDENGKTEERLAGHYLPFGPFLAAAALVVLFAGTPLLAWLVARFFPMLV